MSDTVAVVEPATEQVMAELPRAGADEVDRAVAEAAGAFPAWRALAPLPASMRLEWMWLELPMSFSDGLAMKVAETPLRNAISLTPFL